MNPWIESDINIELYVNFVHSSSLILKFVISFGPDKVIREKLILSANKDKVLS